MTGADRESLEQGVAIALDAANALGGLDRETLESLAADDFRRGTLSGFLRRMRLGADMALEALGEDTQ